MDITDRLERAELIRILKASELWESSEAVEEAVDKMEGFTVLRREGGHIDQVIGDFWVYELDFLAGQVPDSLLCYIDTEKIGRDIRITDESGRAVDELDDPAGRYGRDWLHYVVRLW